ncbi:phase-variable hemagglutinin, partial [Mycoplasma synoviae GX11-T]|nr:phase-variable hemagglutinin [Mycoplasmopsis synoviae GX11-T]
ALLKASSVFPAFKWTEGSIMVPAPEEGALPNPRAWTKAREKSEFVLQNFVMAPAQAATPTTAPTESGSGDGSGGGTSAAASATVRLATGEAAEDSESSEAQTAPTADLASTVSYLKSLNDTLKAATDALNGDNPTTKTAYYKADTTRTLYWDGFMPKIVVDGYVADGEGKGKATHETTNQQKVQEWFNTSSNWEKLSEQLTKKLGSDKFKNVTLTNPQVNYEEVTVNSNTWKNPKVTFNIQAKPGYELTQPTTDSKQISLSIRVLYTSQNQTENALRYQGASSSAVPNRASNPNDATTIKNVNVYLNYTGPAIVLNADLPTVGGQENTSINGTSNVDGTFNTAFRGNPSRGLLFTNRYANPLLKSVINYVNKFDPKYRAEFVTNATNGVTITKVEKTKELRPGTLDDLNKNNVFLQQIQGDTEAVYFAVTAIASNNWLNTFLIRIPLTKFIKPLSVFTAPVVTPPAEEATEGSQTQASTPQTTPNSSQ